ncbi:MAG: 3'-5' exonuclease [Acidobacteriota bacterium]
MTDSVSVSLDFEADLNPEQLAAVTHGEGPQLVLAGAGSGKTRVITYRVAWLIHEMGVDPASIVAVTFTNKAAGEMLERVERLANIYPLPTFVGTFHRFALRLLRRHASDVGLRNDFAIFDSADQISLIKKALASENLSESAFTPRGVLASISSAKNRLMDPRDFEAVADNFYQRQVAKVYQRYQRELQASSGVDFDDMLRLAVKLIETKAGLQERLRRQILHLLVDEFQDTNHAQMKLVREICGSWGNLTAVGDEDQGIYRWRGADLENVLSFESSFQGATIRTLERNYRSTKNILKVSGDLIDHNQQRHGKRLWTDSRQGSVVELYRARDEQDESKWVLNTLEELRGKLSLQEMAILVRTNAQTRAFEEELNRRGIPYVLVGGVRFYERSEIKDLVAYLRVIRNPQDNFSLLRILNRPARGIGKATQQMLEEKAIELGGSIWSALNHSELASFPPRAAKSLTRFRDLIQSLHDDAETSPLPVLLEHVVEKTAYLDLYPDDEPEMQAKRENIREFLTAAQEFTESGDWQDEGGLLTTFLDHVALISDIDQWDKDRGVSLMTLHSAKGLEFRAVVIAGLEDGLLPHFNAGDSQEDVEEERRLLYVGMTRAKERLVLTTCRRRRVAGRYQDREESPFLLEVSAKDLEISESPELFYDRRTEGAYRFFGRREPRDLEVDEFADENLGRGRRVRHPTLGEGVVMSLEGEGDGAKITVFFERAGKRKLVAKFANLEML